MSTAGTPGLHTAVLFIGFKRYDTSRRVFEAIREARPPRLYFACDAARPDRLDETEAVARLRSLVELVDWPCELKTRFSDVNQGVKHGPANAIEWFFNEEEEGIILEDDCLPHAGWWRFAQEMLEHYRTDDRVWAIIGNNLMDEWELKNDDSYYFTAHGYGAHWGWASWRRTWKKYDLAMTHWPELRDSGLLDGYFLSKSEKSEAMTLWESSWNGDIPGWDFQSDYSRVLHGMVNIIPNVNLIRNIGFEGDGSNTVDDRDPRNKDSHGELAFPLKHPKFMLVDAERDMLYFKKYIEPTTLRKIKNVIKGWLPPEVDKAVTPFLGGLQRKLGIR